MVEIAGAGALALRRPRNRTTCMALMNNGLLEVRGVGDGDGACEDLMSPACEYRCKCTTGCPICSET